MKTTKEQMNEELMVIKLFASNYARDLITRIKFVTKSFEIGKLTEQFNKQIPLENW
jgi:hypothetical protein